MPNPNTIRMQDPKDNSLWDIPQENVPKALGRGLKVYGNVGSGVGAIRPWERRMVSATGFDADKISSAGGPAAQWGETGKELVGGIEGIPSWTLSILKDPLHIADPIANPLNKLGKATSGLDPRKWDIPTALGSLSAALAGTEATQKGTIPAIQQVPELMHTPVRAALGLGATGEKLAGADVAEKTAAVGQENKVALGQARSKYETDKASSAKQATEESQRNLVEDRAAHRQELADVAKHNAEIAERSQAVQQAKAEAGKVADKLPELKDDARKAAKAAYPTANGSVADADINSDIQESLQKLKGSANSPAVLSRILGETKPAVEKSVRALTQRELDTAGMASRMLSRGESPSAVRSSLVNLGFAPAQADAIMGVAKGTGKSAGEVSGRLANADRIHGWYSELGDALYSGSLMGDEAAAVSFARGKLLARLRGLYQAEGKLVPFERAQEGWKIYENTFRNDDPVASGGSPIARALKSRDPITGKLRPDFVHDILTDDKNYRVAQELLSRYKSLGAPLDSLQSMKENFDKSKGPSTPKTEPPWARVRPVAPPEEPGSVGVNLKEPPPPFNPTAWRLNRLTELAKSFSTPSKFETGFGAPTIPMRRAMGWLYAHPGFRRWLVNNPPGSR